MMDIEVNTVLVFRVTKTGKEVHIASDKANIEALVEVLKALSSEGTGDVADGLIYELGQASHQSIRSDGTAIPGTTLYDPYPTFPRTTAIRREGPNLQNIPIRTPEGPRIRDILNPRKT